GVCRNPGLTCCRQRTRPPCSSAYTPSSDDVTTISPRGPATTEPAARIGRNHRCAPSASDRPYTPVLWPVTTSSPSSARTSGVPSASTKSPPDGGAALASHSGSPDAAPSATTLPLEKPVYTTPASPGAGGR